MSVRFFNISLKGSNARDARFEAMEFPADQPAKSKRIPLSGEVTITGTAKATLVNSPTRSLGER